MDEFSSVERVLQSYLPSHFLAQQPAPRMLLVLATESRELRDYVRVCQAKAPAPVGDSPLDFYSGALLVNNTYQTKEERKKGQSSVWPFTIVLLDCSKAPGARRTARSLRTFMRNHSGGGLGVMCEWRVAVHWEQESHASQEVALEVCTELERHRVA